MLGTTFQLAGELRRRSGRSDGRRQRYADRLKYFAAATFGSTAYRDDFTVVGNRHFLQSLQVSFDIFPFEFFTNSIQGIIQLLAQDQGQERTKHMAASAIRISYLEKYARPSGVVYI